jgi:hypothetical protein
MCKPLGSRFAGPLIVDPASIERVMIVGLMAFAHEVVTRLEAIDDAIEELGGYGCYPGFELIGDVPIRKSDMSVGHLIAELAMYPPRHRAAAQPVAAIDNRRDGPDLLRDTPAPARDLLPFLL